MNNISDKRGISLVEILISMGILSMILVPVFLTFSSGNRNVMVSESEFRAHAAALEIIEQLISLPFRQIPAGTFSSDEIRAIDPDKALPLPFNITDNPDFKPEVIITEIKKNDKVRFKKIQVNMTFPLAKTEKRERKFTLKTLVANEEN